MNSKHETDDKRRRISELDGIRGLAVALILLQHLWPNVGFWRAALPLTDMGWIGVDLFFVLSGFLITGILLDTRDRPDYFRRFYIRRVFRIFPLYYAFLILAFGFLALWHSGREMARLENQWGSPIWFFAYFANFISVSKGIFPVFGPLGPPWSLQIEEQFYLAWPALVRIFQNRFLPLSIGLLVASLVWRLYWVIQVPDNSMIQYVGTLSRLDSLAAGGLAAFLLRRVDQARLRPIVRYVMSFSIFFLIVFYAAVGNTPSNATTRSVGYSINALAFASLVLWSVLHANERATAILRWKPALWLGRISYGVYLLQLPVQFVVKVLAGSPVGTADRLPEQSLISLVVTLVIAWLSWRYFEKPLQDYGHRLTSTPAPLGRATLAAEMPMQS
jgi:peptidoglycan/LPS O-acetylase OafA/YrhL